MTLENVAQVLEENVYSISVWLQQDGYIQLGHPFLGPLIKGSRLFLELFLSVAIDGSEL